jgi:hypothetical protein
LPARADAKTADQAPAAEWVRAGLSTDRLAWGLRGGLVFGIHPSQPGSSDGAPRGLIRLGYPALKNGGYDLINFIAVEPVVQGRRGFSELELSRLDGAPGKRIWASTNSRQPEASMPPEPGKLTRRADGVEQLEVVLRVERFENGAHVHLVITQHSDAPDEIQIAIHAEPDSAAIEYCILTATMGNKARTRLLWLKDEVLNSRDLYADYRESGFAPHRVFPLERLLRTVDGGVLVALTTDEENPAAATPLPGMRHWHYAGAKVTQYWRKPKGSLGEGLHAAVNARYTYWNSKQPIPGGVAFENFELRERFCNGQCFVFGVTRRRPADLGFRPSGRS